MTQIWVGNPTIIISNNGLSPDRRQAIIWTNDGILLIISLGTHLSEILSELRSFSFKKMYLKMSSAKMAYISSRAQCVKCDLKHQHINIMERQSDIYSGISDISNLISDISSYWEISEINYRYQKVLRDIRKWNSDNKTELLI